MPNYRKNFQTYLRDLAKAKPAPGGGSAVVLSFCLGLSLIAKAMNYSIAGKPKNSRQKINKQRLKAKLKVLMKTGNKVYPYIDKDAELFTKIMANCGKRRLDYIRKSEAMIVELSRAAIKVFSLAKALESGIKKGIISDFDIGLRLVNLTLFGCIANLEANFQLFGRRNKNLTVFKKTFKRWQKA